MHAAKAWGTTLALAVLGTGVGHAAEGFAPRYNLAGSLGGEMFAPPDRSGWGVGGAYTRADVQKVTGGDGHDLKVTTPGGTLAVPGLPGGLSPTYKANVVTLQGHGGFDIYNLAVGYVSQDTYGGGQLAFLVNVPLGHKTQTFTARTSAPGLSWPNATVPDATTRAAVEQQFSASYLAGVNSQTSAESGTEDGLGDVELQAGWLAAGEQWRVLAGVSLVTPTGTYDAAPGPDIGTGNFYTLRPAVQVAWLPTPDWSIAGKLTVGFNTRNKDNDLRSGNWAGLEAAVGYMTPIGPVGLHTVYVQQFQADSQNPYGAARFRSTNVGAFYTTKVPALDAILTLQTMQMVDSRYAKHGTFYQARMIKLF